MPNGDDKFLQSARATLAPGAEARRKSTEAKKALLGTEFEQTAERLRKGASREKGAFKTEIGELGFLRTGELPAGLADISQSLVGDLSTLEIQRAISEANLLLEQSEFEADVEGRAVDLAGRLEQRDRESRAFQAIDLGDRIQFLDASGNVIREERKGSLSGGSSGGLGSGTLSALGSLFGQQQAALPQIDVRQDILDTITPLFSQGVFLQNTERDLFPLIKSFVDEQGGGLTDDEIFAIIFEARKPFESQASELAAGARSRGFVSPTQLFTQPQAGPRR